MLCVLCRSGRSASSCDAERRELHSHAGACGTINPNIVRRSTSCAVPDALRPPATQSVESCIPTLEREERSTPISCDAPRRMPFRTLCVLLRRRASRTAFPRWSVRNDQPQYRATLRVACLSGRFASSCDAERRELHSHAGACGTIISTIVRRSASHAFLDALRPLDDAERRKLHSHARACGTISPNIVRRSASHAFPDALRPPATQSVESCIPTRSVRNDNLNYRATQSVVCLSGRSAFSCDAERRELHSHAGAAERSARISCDAPRRMPFRTLCVLLRRRASRTAFPRWSVRNDQPKYRATLRVACLSGRSASSCDAERRERHTTRSVRNKRCPGEHFS